MPIDGTERLIELLEKSLMIQLYSMGVAARRHRYQMLSKSKTDVKQLLKNPLRREKK